MRFKPFLVPMLTAALCSFAHPDALAGTTGTLRGSIIDVKSRAPVAGARITAESPSQVATTSTDAQGEFRFISLVPDTYVIHAEREGYDPAAQSGISIFADQPLIITINMTPTLKTIARITARGASSQLRPGTTSDLYSVNSAGIKTTVATSGAGSMNQVYGAISSVPGVNIPTNQQGWNQGVYVRGGDYQQVAYEFDGLPLTRQSDLNPIGTLSVLGTQEVQ
ncbi:MAG TPA: carboxypeptidase regulatory-like domain-containing protein, partial [Candidatus Cybelea sp.]|nr:carboxypeptidase regulatory-like domain-containing protein [Candidatus Cybelea sp.]